MPEEKLTIQKLVETPANLLQVYDVQRRYVCLILGQRRPCPNCQTEKNWFEVHGIDPRTATFDDLGETDRPGVCSNCYRTIYHAVPMFGPVGYVWILHPTEPAPAAAEGAHVEPV